MTEEADKIEVLCATCACGEWTWPDADLRPVRINGQDVHSLTGCAVRSG